MSTESKRQSVFKYRPDQTILYALGIGEQHDLRYLYECHESFSVVPSYAILPGVQCAIDFDIINSVMGPEFDPSRLLHGEQYVELLRPVPIEAKLYSSKPEVIEILDKGSAASVIIEMRTYDDEGILYFINQICCVIGGAGNKGRPRNSDNPRIKPVVAPPDREPDQVIEQSTAITQGALYRLSGDRNPLHIDPMFSNAAGHERPILHGLCTLGFATRHLISACSLDGEPSNCLRIKCRFSGVILPGQTIQTEMWFDNNNSNLADNSDAAHRVFFQCRVKETGTKIITGAYMDLKKVKHRQANDNTGKTMNNLEQHRALLDSIPQSGLKCDILFMVIKNRLKEEPEYVKKLRQVFVFNIMKNGQHSATWTVDTKISLEGEVYRSEPRPGTTPDVVLSVEDEDWVKIMVGKLNPQRAFMMGKFRIKGNIMLLQKLHSIWFDLRTRGKAPELDLLQDIMINEQLIPGLKSEAMAIELVQRVVRMPHLMKEINAVIQVNIIQAGRLVTIYSIDMTTGDKPLFKRGEPDKKPDVTFSIDDDDLVLVIYGLLDVDETIKSGRVKIDGNFDIVERAKILFEQPPILARL